MLHDNFEFLYAWFFEETTSFVLARLNIDLLIWFNVNNESRLLLNFIVEAFNNVR